MSSEYSELKTVQQALTRYGMTTYLVFGNIGFFFAIIYFCEANRRRNSCSLYLLSASACRLFALNIGVIPIIYSLTHTDPSTYSLVFCKMQYYLRHVPNQMMRSFIVLACIDRFAMCSLRTRIRSFSKFKVAICMIFIVIIGWLLLSSFILFAQTIEKGKCSRFNNAFILIYTVYNMVTVGFVPPFTMILFGILVTTTLRQLHTRIQPTSSQLTGNNSIQKRDRDLIKMTLIEVIVYLITTAPYTIVLVYSTITSSTVKSNDRQQIESFITYIAQSFLLYLYDALPFWIYIFTSRSFRRQFKEIVLKFFGKHEAQTTTIVRP